MKVFFLWYLLIFLIGKMHQEFSETEIALIISISEAFKCSNSRNNTLPYMAFSPARIIQTAAVLHKLTGTERCESEESEMDKDNFDVNNPRTWNHCALGTCEKSGCSCYAFILGDKCQVFIGKCWLLYCYLKYCDVPYLDQKLVCQCSNDHDIHVTGRIYFYDEGIQDSFRPPKRRLKHNNFVYYVFESTLYKEVVDKVAQLYGGGRALMYLMNNANLRWYTKLSGGRPAKSAMDWKLSLLHDGNQIPKSGQNEFSFHEVSDRNAEQIAANNGEASMKFLKSKLPYLKLPIGYHGRFMEITGKPSPPGRFIGGRLFKFIPGAIWPSRNATNRTNVEESSKKNGDGEAGKYKEFLTNRVFEEITESTSTKSTPLRLGFDTIEGPQNKEKDMGGFQTVPLIVSTTHRMTEPILESVSKGFPLGTFHQYGEQITTKSYTPSQNTKITWNVYVPVYTTPAVFPTSHKKQPLAGEYDFHGQDQSKVGKFGSSDLSEINRNEPAEDYSHEEIIEDNADEEMEEGDTIDKNDIAEGQYRSDESDYEEYDEDKANKRSISGLVMVTFSILLLRL